MGRKQPAPTGMVRKESGKQVIERTDDAHTGREGKVCFRRWDTRAKGWRHSYSHCVPQAQQSWCGNQCLRQTDQASARAVNQTEVLGAASASSVPKF